MPARKNRATEVYEGVIAAAGITPYGTYALLAKAIIEGIMKETVQLASDAEGGHASGAEHER